jgi:hypothetical protein
MRCGAVPALKRAATFELELVVIDHSENFAAVVAGVAAVALLSKSMPALVQ